MKNFLAVTLLAAGTPMISMGDEVRRTQLGNNNSYCQNNEIAWFDWTLVEKHAEILRFVQHLAHLRSRLYGRRHKRATSIGELLDQGRISWHGVDLNEPDWSEDSHCIAVTIATNGRGRLLHVMINAYWEPLEFTLPSIQAENQWRRLIDTAIAPPCDIVKARQAPAVSECTYRAQSRSVVMLQSARIHRQRDERTTTVRRH